MKILCVWELGSSLGHVANLAGLARALGGQGHQVSVALKALQSAGELFRDTPVTVLQAPVWIGPRPRGVHLCSMAHILGGVGYADPRRLAELVLAWRRLFDAEQPDLVIFDYAPTALLASRDQTFKKIVVGNGFAELPPGLPAVNLQPVNGVPERDIAAQESLVVASINAVAGSLGLPPVQVIGDLYQVDSTIISTIPELDLYAGHRRAEDYCPPILLPSHLPRVQWQQSTLPPVFAYLDWRAPNTPKLLGMLVAAAVEPLVYIRGADAAVVAGLRRSGLTVTDAPVDMASVLQQVVLVIAHGGNTIAQSILAGKPVLAVPIQVEQWNVAQRVRALGVGAVVMSDGDIQRFGQTLQSLINDPDRQQRSRRMAEKYRLQRQSLQARIVDRVNALLGPFRKFPS